MKRTLLILTLLAAAAVFAAIPSYLPMGGRTDGVAVYTDSIDPSGRIVRSFGADSVWVFGSDSVLQQILYPDSLSPIERISFGTGRKRKEYRPLLMPDSLLWEDFYATLNARTTKFWLRDTMIYEVHCIYYFESYYSDGALHSTGHQGVVGDYIYPVGLHANYDESGVLFSTENYIFPPGFEENKGKTDGILNYVVESKYYPDGHLEHRQLYHPLWWWPDSSDMNEDEIDLRLGLWEFFDEAGNLVRLERYSHFDEQTGKNRPLRTPDVYRTTGMVLVIALNDSLSVRLRRIARREYAARRAAAAHLRPEPYEVVTNIAEAERMLGGRLSVIEKKSDDYTFHDYEITFNDGTKKYLGFGDYGFIAYFPGQETLLFEGGHTSDQPFDLNDSQAEVSFIGDDFPYNVRTGNPYYHVASPDRRWRINGFHDGQDTLLRFLETWNAAKGKYEYVGYIVDYGNNIQLGYNGNWFWTDNNTVIFTNSGGGEDEYFESTDFYEMTIIENNPRP